MRNFRSLQLLFLVLLLGMLGFAFPDFSSASFTLRTQVTASVRAAADWTPPSVAVVSPGSTVKDIPTISVTATDGESAIASVTLEQLPPGGSNWTVVCTVIITERNSAASPVTAPFLEGLLNTGERIEYVAADNSVVRAGPSATGEDDIVQKRQLPGGGTVTLARSGAVVDERVSTALMPLILIGLGLVVAAALVGFVLARRLS